MKNHLSMWEILRVLLRLTQLRIVGLKMRLIYIMTSIQLRLVSDELVSEAMGLKSRTMGTYGASLMAAEVLEYVTIRCIEGTAEEIDKLPRLADYWWDEFERRVALYPLNPKQMKELVHDVCK